jgi:hypothetical protein
VTKSAVFKKKNIRSNLPLKLSNLTILQKIIGEKNSRTDKFVCSHRKKIPETLQKKQIVKNRRNTLKLKNSGFKLFISCLTKLHQKIWNLKNQLPPACNAYRTQLIYFYQTSVCCRVECRM